jgi:phospholipid/cholesterol/gamma-HCH transport system ATP-binding protein
MDTTKSLIKIENLSVRLDNRDILRNLNFEVYKGECLAVMGLSGVGKSTLLKCIIGLMKPASGKIWIEGLDISTLKGKQLQDLRRDLAMVFQSPALFDSLTIEENVGFGLREHKIFSETRIKEEVQEKLSWVDLDGTDNLYPVQLSGGMQKRASFARAIITNPKIILYDEPTTGLDPIMCSVIGDLIQSFKSKMEATSMLVTHDVKLALSIADRIAMLYEGEIVQLLPTKEFSHSANPVVRQFLEGSTQGPIKL